MRKATAFVAVMAWVVLAVAIAPLFVANGDYEVLAANFGGAAVAAEANLYYTAFKGAQNTLEVVDEGGDIRLNLSRGQNLSYIAWKYTGNGNAKNYCAIAKASNLSCDESVLRNLPVDTLVTVPQSLLKSKFLPLPSAVGARGEVMEVKRLLRDEELLPLQNKLADAQRELWFWRGVCALLIIVMLVVFWVSFGAIKQQERKYSNLEAENENYKKLMPGNMMDFQTREDKTLRAMITKVELIDGKPVVTEVECLAPIPMPISDDTAKCGTRVNPKNFLSHYFKQHPAPIPGQFM